MIEVRCKNCNRLLAIAETINAAMKCHSCKMIFEYKIYTNLSMNNISDPRDLHNKSNDDILTTESTEAKP